MHITTKWFDSKYPTFNIEIASAEGREPFITIRDCKLIEGKNGVFISYPAKKMESGKYWNHVVGNEQFNEAVVKKAQAAQPQQKAQAAKAGSADLESDIPF